MGGYILCRARGGFNNALNVLQLAVESARLTNRTLLIEFPIYKSTPLESIFDFSNFPCSVLPATPALLQQLYATNEILDSEPPYYTKEYVLGPKEVKWDHSIQRFAIDKQVPMAILTRSIPSTTLFIIDGCMNGTNGFLLFRNLKFQPSFLHLLKNRRAELPSSYKSLHIRDTDKKTDWHIFAPKVHTYCSTSEPVLLCTDTPSVKRRFLEYSNIVYSSSWMPPNVSRNLHYQGITNRNVLPDALCDLFLLCLGSDFLESCPSSGYSQFIRLFRNNSHLLHSLIESESPP